MNMGNVPTSPNMKVYSLVSLYWKGFCVCLLLETANPAAKADEQQPMAELQEQKEEIETLVEKMERRSLDNSADCNVVAKQMKTEGKVSTIQENMTAEPASDPTQVGFACLWPMFCARRWFMAFQQ